MYRPHISPSVSTIPTRKPCQILFAPSTSSAPYTHPNSFWNFQALLANFRHPHRKFPCQIRLRRNGSIPQNGSIPPWFLIDSSLLLEPGVREHQEFGKSQVWLFWRAKKFVTKNKREGKKLFCPLKKIVRWSYLPIGQYVGPTQPITDVGPRDCSLKPLLWEVSVRTHKTSWQNPRGICGDITYHNTSSLPTSHLKFQVKFVLMSPARSRSSTAWRRPHS